MLVLSSSTNEDIQYQFLNLPTLSLIQELVMSNYDLDLPVTLT